MLEITGKVGAKTYKKEILSADEVIDLFGLNFLKGKESVNFKLNDKDKRVVAINMADKKPRFPIGYNLACFVNGFYQGNNVQVRYYETHFKNTKGIDVYSPKAVAINGKSTRVYMDKNREQAVFMTLFPFCGQSPLRDIRRHQLVYLIDNPEAEARAELNTAGMMAQLYEKVMSANEQAVMIWANGITIRKQRISANQANTPDLARIALIRMAQKYPKDVWEALGSHLVLVTGTVIKTIHDKKIVRTVNNKRTTWAFAINYGGEEIAEVATKPSDVGALVQRLGDAQLWKFFTDRLYNTSNVIDTAETVLPDDVITGYGDFEPMEMKAEPPKAEIDPDDILGSAIRVGAVNIHPEVDKVCIVDEGGEFEKRALIKLDGGRDDWQLELKSRMNNIIEGRLKKRLGL